MLDPRELKSGRRIHLRYYLLISDQSAATGDLHVSVFDKHIFGPPDFASLWGPPGDDAERILKIQPPPPSRWVEISSSS